MAEVERHDDEQPSGSVWEYLTQKDAEKTSSELFREQQEQEREVEEAEPSVFDQFTPEKNPAEALREQQEQENNPSLLETWLERRDNNPMSPGHHSPELQEQISSLTGPRSTLPEKGLMDQLFAQALGNTVGFFAGGKDGEEKTSGETLDAALIQQILDTHHAPQQQQAPEPER